MANISDGYGTITVLTIGKQFLEFINKVQKDAYYLLLDSTDGQEVDENGDVSFTFGAGGRWNYEANIKGYLNGEWMNGDKEKEAYDKFIKAFKRKGGSITIEYSDSDTATGWMGNGVFEMTVNEGEIEFSHNFEEQELTIENFAEQQGEDAYWAMGYIYGDEVTDEYDKYVEKCEKKGDQPVEPQEWFETIYEQEV